MLQYCMGITSQDFCIYVCCYVHVQRKITASAIERVCAGWYCVGCEEYKQNDEIDEQHMCPVHRKPCIHREEENFFFRLSSYQQQLEVRSLSQQSRPKVALNSADTWSPCCFEIPSACTVCPDLISDKACTAFVIQSRKSTRPL